MDRYIWENRIARVSCHYVDEDLKDEDEDSTYKNALWLRDQMAPYYGQEFNLSKSEVQNMRFVDANGYSDVLISEMFEGIPTVLDYTAD